MYLCLPFYRHKREMTELQKRHNDEYAQLMLKVRSLHQENTTVVPETSRDSGEASAQNSQREHPAEPPVESERRTISRHGSQELLDCPVSTCQSNVQVSEQTSSTAPTPSTMTKKDSTISNGGSGANTKREPGESNRNNINLEAMYKQQLDLMGVKSDNKSPKPEVKPAKPSLNELKMKKQAEQMCTQQQSITESNHVQTHTTTASESCTYTCKNGTATPSQRKSSVPVIGHSYYDQNTFFHSLNSLNLSHLLHSYERRTKSKTAPVQSAAVMAAVAEATQQEQTSNTNDVPGESVGYSHYHTIGAGDPHVIWTHGRVTSYDAPSQSETGGSNERQQQHDVVQQQYYQQLFQQQQQQATAQVVQQTVSQTQCEQQQHEQQNYQMNVMSSSWPAADHSMFDTRSVSMGHLENIATLPANNAPVNYTNATSTTQPSQDKPSGFPPTTSGLS